jgi:hypothetical protein
MPGHPYIHQHDIRHQVRAAGNSLLAALHERDNTNIPLPVDIPFQRLSRFQIIVHDYDLNHMLGPPFAPHRSPGYPAQFFHAVDSTLNRQRYPNVKAFPLRRAVADFAVQSFYPAFHTVQPLVFEDQTAALPIIHNVQLQPAI